MWKRFEPETCEEGVYWFFGERPVYDVDVDNDGRTIGRPTGETEAYVCMADFWRDCDGDFNFRRYEHPDIHDNLRDDDFPSWCMKVEVPKPPTEEMLTSKPEV